MSSTVEETTRQRMRGADALVETLAAYETELVVAFIGHTTHELADAFHAQGGIRSFHPVTEMGGGYIVNGYNYVKGRPAAVGLWHTIGSLVVTTPVYEAQIARIPSVHITMNVDSAVHGREAMQEMPNVDVFRSITQSAVRCERPERMPELIHKAFQIAQLGRPGPALVDIPYDFCIDEAEIELPRGWRGPNNRQYASPEDAAAAAELLVGAERPVILAGGGAVASGAEAEVLALAEMLGIPVVTTSTGRGIVDEDHPLALGLTGTIGSPAANALVAEADVALVVGSRLADWGYAQSWVAELPGKLIHVDSDGSRVGDFYFPEIGIVGDARAVIGQIVAAVREQDGFEEVGHEQRPRSAELAERKATWRATVEQNQASDQWPMSPWRVVRDVQSQLADDDIIVTDVGDNTGYVFQSTVVHKPRTLLAPFGVASLGTALPMAIGAKLARPEANTVVITGDGGFQYTLNEISTAIREQTPLVVVVLNNGVLGSTQSHMQGLFGHETWVTLQNPDFAALAKSYGADGEQVTAADGVADAVRRGIDSGGVYVVDVPVDKSFGYPATGAGPVVKWEPRLWPSDVTGIKQPGRFSLGS